MFELASAMGGMFLLVLLLVIGLVVWSVYATAKRRDALRAWCARNGWTYVGDYPDLHEQFNGTPFGQGHSRRSNEAVVGSYAGYPAVSFAYTYQTGSGDDETTWRYHVAAVQLPVPVPWLQITAEGFGSRLATLLGSQDITFESAAFNERWRVQSPSLRFAHDVVHTQLMELLLKPEMQSMSLRFDGTHVLTWVRGVQDPMFIFGRLQQIVDVLATVRPYVWQDLGLSGR